MTANHAAPSADFNELLLRLYRLSYELPISAFQDAALGLVRQVLPFDSSMWGTATSTPQGIDIHTIHLQNQPVEMLAAYEAVKHLDTAAQAVGQQPRNTLGFNADDWFSGRHQGQLRDYGRRFEQANFFITSDANRQTDFVHWITLFRADADARCTEAERALLAALSPHVMQALALNRITHLDRREQPQPRREGSAISDPRGVIYHADPAFHELLAQEWTGWHGNRLPDALLTRFLQGHASLAGAATVVTHHVEQGLLFLTARERCRADDLTPREHTVAQLVARGSSHKEIARLLERSPATVRNQIRSVYDKLEVSNVAGLIEALRGSD